MRGLQTTLNKRGYDNPQHILPHLKEDGDFGPRTLARLDEELLRGGPSSVIRDLNGMAVTQAGRELNGPALRLSSGPGR